MDFNFKKTKEKLVALGLCDHCLGRQFTHMFKGKENGEIGAAVRNANTEKEVKFTKTKPTTGCEYCKDLFTKVEDTATRSIELTANYEHETFLVGCSIDKALGLKEEELWSEVGAAHCEPLKKELVRTIGKIIEQKTGKKAEFNTPDITILIDFTRPKPKIRLQLHALFMYGDYQKTAKIPQTKWFCRECRGRGCKHCNMTGKMYEESVEELVAKKVMDETGGKNEKFHGSGREDIDAKMLGWRPFVLEVLEPVKRDLDFEKLEKEINAFAKGKVEVRALRKSNKEEVRFLKAVKHDKTYEMFCECENNIDDAKLREIEKVFSEIEIDQRTPQRVAHRRADLVRKRKVKNVKCEMKSKKEFRVVVICAAGLYAKELVSGDEGRTKPCFADFVGPCKCAELNVLEVHVNA